MLAHSANIVMLKGHIPSPQKWNSKYQNTKYDNPETSW